jgi:primosomal protein N' (replication factor Y)
MMAPGRDPPILRVAVAVPLRRLFDYLPPPGHAGAILPGTRLLVPFGRKRRVGVVVAGAATADCPPERLRAALAVLDPSPTLDPTMLAFCLWASRYYQHPIGEVLAAALPRERVGEGDAPVPTAPPAHYRLADTAPPLLPASAHRQTALLALLAAHPAGLPAAAIRALLPAYRPALTALLRRGAIQEETPEGPGADAPVSPPGAGTWVLPVAPPPFPLSPPQTLAVAAIQAALPGFHAFVLQGITGSGKTEVYLRAIHAVVAAGRQALVLVPEIALTEQVVLRFRRDFGEALVHVHSRLAEGARERARAAAATGQAAVVLGTRSALWLPMPRLGLIVVDEEHDTSYKQQDGFRYHARDLAVVRARGQGVPVVLGSATPSLETLHNVQQGRYAVLHLPERAAGAMPAVEILDLRGQPLQAGLSRPLLQALAANLAAGRQSLLFLNRRGFAPAILCHGCGAGVKCPHCDTHLTYHQARAALLCHHCGLRRPFPPPLTCCAAPEVIPVGVGTEQIDHLLQQHLPTARIRRFDRDTTQKRGSIEEILGAVRAGEVDILVGTQMLAKGHHFPGMTLVGVVHADAPLYSADFRLAERLAQLLVQVAGRAGRGEVPGRVLIQTHNPEHPVMRTLLAMDYPRFAAAALVERQAASLPPFARLALLRAEAESREAAIAFLGRCRRLAESLLASGDGDGRSGGGGGPAHAPRAKSSSAQGIGAQGIGAQGIGGIVLLGPFPAAMERRAGRYRAHLLFQAQGAGLTPFLAELLLRLEEERLAPGVRWGIDVDPQDTF